MQSMTDIAVNYKMDMELSNSNIKYGQWMKTSMVCLNKGSGRERKNFGVHLCKNKPKLRC